MLEQTREAYLERYVEALRPLFAEHSFDVPAVRVSAGFPATGGLGARKRRLGECWPSESSSDSAPQIFVNPTLPASEVGHVLVHELLHACLPGAKHGKRFANAAAKLGLEGKPTATTASEALQARLNAIEVTLGVNPWAMLTHVPKPKKQATRLLKAVCACDEPRIIRVTASVFEVAPIICGECNESFALEGSDGEEPRDGRKREESEASEASASSSDSSLTQAEEPKEEPKAIVPTEPASESPSTEIPAEPEVSFDNVEAIARKRALEAIERICVPLAEPEVTVLPSGSRIVRKHRLIERAIDV